MNTADYQLTEQRILMLANLAADLDLEEFLRAIDRTVTVGPLFVAPVAYTTALPRLEAIAKCARALRDLQRARQDLVAIVERQEKSGAAALAREVARQAEA